ncbi:MAG: transposase [Ferrovum myxofaciens]|uniref:Transposase n=1 Tax=Ferrovum myxofaciens TaxID=416213 RepID=A0A9E6MWF1_9PROT|nr:MAG: transposase [Ferrovum myxofaciens]QWY74908.1 MAG: transposase [Ferrovum myxofaciens]QWY77656.1 MAG: transposase [Ferrovum myxofaciens]
MVVPAAQDNSAGFRVGQGVGLYAQALGKRWHATPPEGDLPIDNNRIENAIRPIAIGKKNGYLQDRLRPGFAQRPSRPCWERPK